MITIYDSSNDQEVATCETAQEALRWVYEKADQLNYGLFRSWEVEGFRYYDCGPRTFKIALGDLVKN